MAEKIKIGIYKIQSKIKPEKFYIGSAVNIKKRWWTHKRDLNKNIHPNQKLQNHYNKYGINDLVFSIILLCEKVSLLNEEQKYIDTLNPIFNISKVVRSPMLGLTHSIEYRKRLSERMKGKRYALGYKQTAEAIEEIRRRGRRKCKEATKKKISDANKGRKCTQESIEKNRQCHIEYYKTHKSPRLGVTLSAETKRKLSNSHKGKKLSESQKNNISKALSGKRFNGIKVKCLNTGRIYKSIQLASDEIGISQTHLSRMLKGKRKNKTSFILI